jgi:predicted negative regulator of RcsB-dependent stress response
LPQHSISRKELKKDEIRDTLSHGAEAVMSHQKLFGVIITIAVFVAVAIMGWRFYTERQTVKASAALSTAMKTFQARIRTPGEPADPIEVTFVDEKIKFADAQKKFDDIAKKYPRTRPGQLALYYSALSQEKLGNNNQAAETLKKLQGSNSEDIASLAQFQLAEVYLKMGKSADAIQIYRQLVAKPTVFVPKPLVMLALGDALAKSNPQEAVKIFSDIKKDFPESAASDEADKRLELLNAKT